MRSEGVHRAECAEMGLTADHRFREQDRQGKDEGAHYVDKYEGRASIFTDHIGESPDVAESDGGAGEGHNHGSSAAEVFSV